MDARVIVKPLAPTTFYCGKLLNDFRHDRNRRGHVWYRWFNELPVLLLIGAVLLVVLKPF